MGATLVFSSKRRSRPKYWLLSTALLLLALPAVASPLDDAKAAGWLGERPDGYVGLVDSSAPSAVQDLVKEINTRRRAKYREIAEKSGTSVEVVARAAGAKLVERTAKGHYVLDASGKWLRK